MFNGDLKSLLLLWEYLAKNHRYQNLVEGNDLRTFQKRAGNEGLTFLTVALPSLGKALDTFHSTNEWKAPIHFKTDSDGIPLFLGKAIRLAIDGNSIAVDCVRQLTYAFYKLEVPYEESKVANFLDQFISTDQDLGRFDYATGSLPSDNSIYQSGGRINTGALIKEMRGLISKVLLLLDPKDIRPCHGSGATACRTPNHSKWHELQYIPKIDDFFGYSDNFFYSPSHLCDELDKLQSAPHMDPVARVCLVPKDSRGPRVISCEPAAMMFIQQGLMRKLYHQIENHPFTRGRINFTDQSQNRKRAELASITDQYATIDLKDASDRVSLQLVRLVFPDEWVQALEACRSEETLLPDGRRIKLNKFAPMGSACCFPVEALVFWACASAMLRLVRTYELEALWANYQFEDSFSDCPDSNPVRSQRYRAYQAGLKVVETWSPDLLVYGDDIICDSVDAQLIMDGLEMIGLLVNRDKSYVVGPFRESCGGDYHLGMDVTPVRIRKWLTNVGTGLQASADLANEFIAKFGYEDSHKLIRVIEEAVGYSYPRTDMDIPMTIRVSPSASNDVLFRRRWNKDLQRFEHRLLCLRYSVKEFRSPEWGELLRKELSRDRTEVQDPFEPELSIFEAKLDPGQYTVSHSVHKKWAWVWLGCARPSSTLM
jgi:hypothetical protein